MMVVLSYDVDTSDSAGAKRLRKVAKVCEAYGCRVQNSVFELLIEPAQLVALKARLTAVIDADKDSVRFYRLGSNWRPRVESLGRGLRFEQDDVLLL
ncbi:MAG: CRISPR-associated endonuclease Cas2 [Oscillospiraceae bacterium]|nr:CRISPR-associated endonuclease Cas2 [Clostridiales bacterium]MDY2962358.1 CRISPR-associated endonuclease Cas2 [Oscillospiraceae bacterium]MDD6078350.1 CRISPR-associated endonuclease Cas2 [Clostridiales bacterium]MDD6107853.1 CRISPR-associated endonuclease Cas2 [Clostridiales bacterium]MDD6935473.1 CRISPR-associated endonuclease Cas2 [Clostridiales bacterium]